MVSKVDTIFCLARKTVYMLEAMLLIYKEEENEMSGFWFVVTSMLVYDLVVTERTIVSKQAKSYQRQKSKVVELRRRLRNHNKNSQH